MAEEDLERTLVGVMRIVEAEAVATGDAEQRVGVVAEDVEDELLRFGR